MPSRHPEPPRRRRRPSLADRMARWEAWLLDHPEDPARAQVEAILAVLRAAAEARA